MKSKSLFFLLTLSLSLSGSGASETNWFVEPQNGYSIYYTIADKKNISEYKAYFEVGKKTVEAFFQGSFRMNFSIYIHPSRLSLDSAWQNDWGMPEFNSQCWMVASGVAQRLDIISPKKWDDLSCEHIYSDSTATQYLITHELVHVFHGQQNISPDFSDITNLDWFVEGLAVYASGQCDSTRIEEVKKFLTENNIPSGLNEMWSGKLKYGLSGTGVMYLDKQYGREIIISLLKLNRLEELLDALDITEAELLTAWKEFILRI